MSEIVIRKIKSEEVQFAIGFVPVDKQLQMNGIIYTPMKYVITK